MFKDGVTGVLYQPEEDRYQGKALLVFGGGDGSFSDTKKIAEVFAYEGISVLAIAYWKEKGLPVVSR